MRYSKLFVIISEALIMLPTCIIFTKTNVFDFHVIAGKTELELPDTRKRMGDKASFVNVYPFIWNDFAESGYVTGTIIMPKAFKKSLQTLLVIRIVHI
jgi:hypothetical protein